jgi:hypothetical protein
VWKAKSIEPVEREQGRRAGEKERGWGKKRGRGEVGKKDGLTRKCGK